MATVISGDCACTLAYVISGRMPAHSQRIRNRRIKPVMSRHDTASVWNWGMQNGHVPVNENAPGVLSAEGVEYDAAHFQDIR